MKHVVYDQYIMPDVLRITKNDDDTHFHFSGSALGRILFKQPMRHIHVIGTPHVTIQDAEVVGGNSEGVAVQIDTVSDVLEVEE